MGFILFLICKMAWSKPDAQFIQQVNAKTVIPIHTENAETFKEWTRTITLLRSIGDNYTF
jgi:hypothetical protein